MGIIVNIFVCFVLSLTLASPPSITKRYRTDYEYSKMTDSFYKLHIEERSYDKAFDVCKAEGAELMVPSTVHDIRQCHVMIKKYPDLGEYVWIGDDGQHHDLDEEEPTFDLFPTNTNISMDWEQNKCVVLSRKGEIETSDVCAQHKPFICKVTAKDAPYDGRCGVYGNDYRYYPSVRSCYKIPSIAYTWSESYAECAAEGAHLVVLNSQEEHDAVHNLTNTEPRVPGARAFFYFFAGYRAEKPKGNATLVFKTIFNQTLEEAGYSSWSDTEPNNASGTEYCGSIFLNDGKLNDIDCEHQFGFICEKEVPRLGYPNLEDKLFSP